MWLRPPNRGTNGVGTGVQSSTEREEENQEGEAWEGRWGQTMPGNLTNRVGLYPQSSEFSSSEITLLALKF